MINDNDYKRYKKFAYIVTKGNSYYAEEILQGFFLKIVESGIIIPNDNYVFIALKNRLSNLIDKKRASDKKHLRMAYEENDIIREDNVIILENSDYDLQADADFEIKKEIIEKVISSLDYFHKQLYILHFINGFSQRKISRESGISLWIILDKIKKIKMKIELEYNKIKDEERDQ